MESTMTGRLVLVFVLVTFSYAVEARSADGPILLVSMGYNEIPQRCIDYNITSVSCEHVTSDDGLLPHPDDCQLFYYCVSADSAPICRQCPAALHFNPEKHVCDLPGDAGCVASK